MDRVRWQRIEELFLAAVDEEPAKREEVLIRGCESDAILLADVQKMLAAHDRASSFIEFPAFDTAPREEAEILPSLAADQRIGRYTIRGILGAGGMGTVYEAEQDSPCRTVALKLMHSLPIRDELTSRFFQREGQALARLQHAGIATIYEAGQSQDGWYYFAMERVDGISLTAFARERNLSIEERLKLFGRVCEAVHYAHQRGVIHRDLKPSNILVTKDGQPKVLDFGLARILDPEGDIAQVTQSGAFHGTLGYASPEQARGRPDDIDARSDVYSLGVILYELLTGQLPYELNGLTFLEASRVICEAPPRPAGAINGSLRGELETIICKALEKEPARRYGSAAALEEDTQRYLNRQPILAHRPSAAYQIRKLVTRNKVLFSLIVTLMFVITGSAIAMGWLALRFARQRDIARDAQMDASQARDSAEEYARFLEKLFEEARLGGSSTKTPTLRQVLDEGYARLERVENPLVRARLMTVMGSVYAGLDQGARSRELLEKAVEIRRNELGPNHPDVAESLICLATALSRMNQPEAGDVAAAGAIDIFTNHFGPEHAQVAKAWKERAALWYYNGDHAAAAEYFRRAMDINRRLYGMASPEHANAQVDLGWALFYLNRLDEAEPLMKEALNIHRNLGNVAESMAPMEWLAQVAWRRGDNKESERLYAEELELARGVYDAGHPKLAWIISNYAYTIEHNQGLAPAEPLYRQAVQILRQAGAEGHRELSRCLKMLGRNLLRQEKYDEAAEMLQQAADIQVKLLGANDEIAVDTLKLLNEARSHGSRSVGSQS